MRACAGEYLRVVAAAVAIGGRVVRVGRILTSNTGGAADRGTDQGEDDQTNRREAHPATAHGRDDESEYYGNRSDNRAEISAPQPDLRQYSRIAADVAVLRRSP